MNVSYAQICSALTEVKRGVFHVLSRVNAVRFCFAFEISCKGFGRKPWRGRRVVIVRLQGQHAGCSRD